jgi:hypothetical protein
MNFSAVAAVKSVDGAFCEVRQITTILGGILAANAISGKYF